MDSALLINDTMTDCGMINRPSRRRPRPDENPAQLVSSSTFPHCSSSSSSKRNMCSLPPIIGKFRNRRTTRMHAPSLSLLLLILGISSPLSSSAAGIYNRDEASDRHDKIQAAALAFAGYDRHHGARQPPPPLQQDEGEEDSPPPSLDDTLFCTTHRHLHLAVGHDPSTSMTVSFSSEPCDYGHSPPPHPRRVS